MSPVSPFVTNTNGAEMEPPPTADLQGRRRPGAPRSRSARALIARLSVLSGVAGLLVGAGSGEGAEPVHLKIGRQKAAINLRFSTDAANYYEAWKIGPSTDWRLSGMVLGTGTEQIWADPIAREDSHGFYRLVAKSLSQSGDVDGDGFDDVYELAHGMDALVADVAQVSISVGKTQIAAGALDSAPHQTEVTLKVVPAGPLPVLVWLEGGKGFGSSSISGDGKTSHQVGPAKLSGSGQTYVAGGDRPSGQPIRVTANANGEVLLRLTSSNLIGENCTVRAQVGTLRAVGHAPAVSPEIRFEAGTMTVDFPGVIFPGSTAPVVVTRTFNGEPLVGHDIFIFVKRTQVDGQTLSFSDQAPHRLESYASIDSNRQRQMTDVAGMVGAEVMIQEAEGLGNVEIDARDLHVFTLNP